MQTYSLEEQAKHRREWTTALRSGEYTQCLDWFKNYKGEYCATGVGYELSTDFKMPKDVRLGADLSHIRIIGRLENTEKEKKEEFCNYYGLRPYEYEEIINENDDGASFEDLANYIDSLIERG